jgi:hypothetical protein
MEASVVLALVSVEDSGTPSASRVVVAVVPFALTVVVSDLL